MRRIRRKVLSHVAADGALRMVDVSAKPTTVRQATASAIVTLKPVTLKMLMRGDLPKGEALAAARLAGIAAAKRTSTLIPLCHSMALEWSDVQFETVGKVRLLISCTAKTSAKTGVEMEALVGAAMAALTVYDMAKSADKSIVIGPIQLEHKSGGRSGTFERRTRSARPKTK